MNNNNCVSNCSTKEVDKDEGWEEERVVDAGVIGWLWRVCVHVLMSVRVA